MSENTNRTTKWLQYLLYVGIAATVNTILSVFLPSVLSAWISYTLTAATVYLMFRLIGSNGRYQKAVLFSGVSLAIAVLGIRVLGLAGDICSIVGQYQEYHAHGELIQERNPKLADKWSSLFWFQFAASVVLILLTSVITAFLVVATNMGEAVVTALATVVAAVLVLALKVAYLLYLQRTIKALETEIVVE